MATQKNKSYLVIGTGRVTCPKFLYYNNKNSSKCY